MWNKIFSHTKHFIISSSIATTFLYALCYYKTKKNQKQYLAAVNADTLKDASRLTNQSFGISWGFQADDTIMNSIDSGDLFFVKYDCRETLDPLEMIKCYQLTFPLLDEEYHTIAVAYRDQSGLMAYSHEFGENKLMKYSQFVSLPYIKQLMVQKTSANIHKKLQKLLQQDKAFNNLFSIEQVSVQNDIKSQSSVVEKLKCLIIPKQDTLKFINRVLRRTSITNENEQILNIQDLLTDQKQTIIRTQTNRILRSL